MLLAGLARKIRPHGNLITVQPRIGEVRCVVGHAGVAFFEIEDNNGYPLNVIIRTRFHLVFFFCARLVATPVCLLIRTEVPWVGVKT